MFNFYEKKMKKVSLFGAVFLMAVAMFTSCLGEGSNEQKGEIVGIVTTHDKTFEKVLNIGGGSYFRSSNFDNINEGACYWVYYDLNMDAENNANANTTGYYNVTVLDRNEFERNEVFPVLTDTAQILDSELAILNPIYRSFGYIEDRIFFIHALNQPKEQQNYWNLSYSSENMMTEENGARIYELFLRATVKSSTSNSSEDQPKWCAYRIKDFFEKAAIAEKEKGKQEIQFRINYVSKIEDDKITWNKTQNISCPISLILNEKEK